MDQYRYIKEFYLIARIKQENIIIQDIDIKEWGTVYIYIVEKNSSGFYIYKASGTTDKPINFDDLHYITLAECELRELLQKIK
ncbi:MAG: hypothetical protein K0R54_4310 [Clostridiaceae bacterium]|jgi:hypothetical protein|nr:hypothetical protein [Clostridiaceae bacterium]